MDITDQEKIENILYKLKSDNNITQMKQYVQHGRVSTYEHCERVARFCYLINKRFGLNADVETLLIGAMLHDFYLYDWHDKDDTHKWHGYHHADTALANAIRYFEVNEEIQHIIWCHMWPLNISRFPKTKEARIVCFADKCCSIVETFCKR